MTSSGTEQPQFSACLRERLDIACLPPTLINEDQAGRLYRYYSLLRKWNARVNLTALDLGAVPSGETIDRLFVEALVASRYLHAWASPQDTRWFDLGSGGGSPAIPLRILRGDGHLILVESRAKKAAFLREAIRTVGLEATAVAEMRVEDLVREYSVGHASLVTVRGLRLDSVVSSVSAALLRPGGQLFVFATSLGTISSDASFRLEEQAPLLSSGSLFVLDRV